MADHMQDLEEQNKEFEDISSSLKDLLARVRAAKAAPKPTDSVAGLLAQLEKELSQASAVEKISAKAAIESLLSRVFPETAARKDVASTTTHQTGFGQGEAFGSQLSIIGKAHSDSAQTSAPVPIERQLTQAREDGYQNGWKKGKEVGLKIGEAKGVEKGRKMGRWSTFEKK